jgi:hypothetical protein
LKATVANHGPQLIARTRRSQQLIHPGFGVRFALYRSVHAGANRID